MPACLKIELHTLHEQLFIQIRSSGRHYLSWSKHLRHFTIAPLSYFRAHFAMPQVSKHVIMHGLGSDNGRQAVLQVFGRVWCSYMTVHCTDEGCYSNTNHAEDQKNIENASNSRADFVCNSNSLAVFLPLFFSYRCFLFFFFFFSPPPFSKLHVTLTYYKWFMR